MDLHTSFDLVQDFVNTFDLETGVDRIGSPDELAAWFSEHGLAEDLVEPSEQDYAEAIAVREAVRDLLLAHNGVDVDTSAAAATLEAAARTSGLGLRFDGERPLLLPEGNGAAAALGRIVATVAELAPTPEWKRLKACRDDHCRVAFYDHSRNRSRAWCSMEVCGNREKARSFRARQRA